MISPKRSRSLRRTSSLAERALWDRLRNRQLHGYKFRRQQRIGPYIADFACLECRLLLEVDGGQHALRTEDDRRRDA
jgi:very-short-patch-repair endonuclease